MIAVVPPGWSPPPESSLELLVEITEVLRTQGVSVPFYENLLCETLGANSLPFASKMYGDLFRERASEPQWLARSLVTNAKKEAQGADILWQMAGEVASTEVSQQVHRHAVDESNHAQYYIRMIELAFPGCADGDVSQALHAIPPGYSMHFSPNRKDCPDSLSVTLDELVQINIGEIRTRIHQMLLWSAITRYCPPENLGKIKKLVAMLVRDETRHVAYTAQILERFAMDGCEQMIRSLYYTRLDQFCTLTREELQGSLFEGS